MLQQLRPLISRYAELSSRERAMLGVAALALVYFVLDSMLVTPQLTDQANLASKESSQKAERSAMLAALNKQTMQANEALEQARVERDALQVTVNKGELLMRRAERSTDVAPLLRRMVQTTPGLQLIALRTSPSAVFFQPQAAVPPAAPPDKETGNAAKPPEAVAPPVNLPTLHSKAVEATVQGNYLDLLTYLRLLREYPGALYWDSATVTVNNHPQASLRLMMNVLTTRPDTPNGTPR